MHGGRWYRTDRVTDTARDWLSARQRQAGDKWRQMGSVWIRRRQSCNRRGEEWRAALGPTNDNVVVLHLAVLLTHTRCRSTVFFYLARGRLFLLGCKRHALSNYPRMNSEMESFNWVWFAGHLTAQRVYKTPRDCWLLFKIYWICQMGHILGFGKTSMTYGPFSSAASLKRWKVS